MLGHVLYGTTITITDEFRNELISKLWTWDSKKLKKNIRNRIVTGLTAGYNNTLIIQTDPELRF